MKFSANSVNRVSGQSLELAHVLDIDLVGYSLLPTDSQQGVIEKLQATVRETEEFKRALGGNELICLPTGDGLALVFFREPEAPVRCALELTKALRQHPEIKLRMGIHSGPVYRMADINANLNVAGGGINLAQRVMDCGDAGHILVSKAAADVLNQVGSWKQSLHDLGETEVKHGLQLHLFNLWTEEAGKRERPTRLRLAHARRVRFALAMTVPAIAIAVALGSWLIFGRKAHAIGEADTIVLADFDNKTGDPVFDDTLKTGLIVALTQSPFLNVLSENKVATTLKLMSRPAGTSITGEVAREVCQRANSKAYIAGSINTMGSQYVLGLKAVNCQSGDVLVREQVTAAGKEKVLDALGGAATKLRGALGESLATVQKFDVPLAEAATTSLEALKAYTLGRKAFAEKGPADALPYDRRAIQLDPNFAMAYRSLGTDYYDLTELERASEYFTRAFKLREHASEREMLTITANYYLNVTGELDKAAQANREQIESYPRDFRSYEWLGVVLTARGQYEKAADAYRQSLRLEPDHVTTFTKLGNTDMALQRFEEARQTIRDAQARKLEDFAFHNALYALAFLKLDSASMVDEQKWFTGKPEENSGLSLASDSEAYSGHLAKARELTRQSVDSALRADSKENGAIWRENSALREAAFGNAVEAKQAAAEGLKLTPASQGVEVEAALAYAMAGDTARAESLAQELNKRFPVHTQMQSLWLPAVRAQVALNKKNPTEALNELQVVSAPIEFGQNFFVTNISCLYPTYIHGEAYLAAGQGSAAAAEFQKILDHSGIVWNCWTGALGHLGVARANALEAKSSQGADAEAAQARALAAYKDFLTFWKDADPDIPVLKEAKAEYAKLH